MSIYSNAGNATLGQIIAHLETLPLNQVVEHGFCSPHSYRGYYEDLAFEPAENITVKAMLDAARSARGKTFSGYEGGEYRMTDDTDCWLAEYGRTGVPIVLSGELIVYVLPTSTTVKGHE